MWLFVAHYVNMDTLQEITRPIEFTEQSLESTKECYLCAMSIACDKTESGECLSSLEFIAC